MPRRYVSFTLAPMCVRILGLCRVGATHAPRRWVAPYGADYTWTLKGKRYRVTASVGASRAMSAALMDVALSAEGWGREQDARRRAHKGAHAIATALRSVGALDAL